MTNNERSTRGSQLLEATRENKGQGAAELAVNAIANILHAACVPGDELAAEDILRRAKAHYIAECDEEWGAADEGALRTALPEDADWLIATKGRDA